MAHESFEDDEVAGYLNEHFVSIKVDREERPDVDSIYMSVCQALTGQGGWPLTVVLTPDKRAFFAGTYFPKDKKYGRVGLMDILQRLQHEWTVNRDKVEATGDTIAKAIREQYQKGQSREEGLSPDLLDDAFVNFAAEFDAEYGGFGGAPKFPTPHNLSFLLRYYQLTGEVDALDMTKSTLQAMRSGGIWDHVGWGFARYSVDRMWMIPHFEKMLYDNALLAIAYLEAYQVTGDAFYSKTAVDIFQYVEREMTSPGGGFYSAQDADSEGQEGKFYAFDEQEIREIVSTACDHHVSHLYCQYYAVRDAGNFDGKNVLHTIRRDKETFAAEHGLSVADLDARLEEARQCLFSAREKRVHPHKDDKVLTAWNGLMIAALAKGMQVLDDARFGQMAKKAAEFIRTHLVREDGRLLARFRDNEAAIPAYLDDYAFLVWGLVELYEATFDEAHLEFALDLTRKMMTLFHDPDGGGFFLTGSDSEELIARPRDVYDGALPSGNSVAAFNLARLGRLTSDLNLMDTAEECLKAFAGQVKRYPAGYTHYLMALMYVVYGGREIVVAGEESDEVFKEMVKAVQSTLLPTSVWIARRYETLRGLGTSERNGTGSRDGADATSSGAHDTVSPTRFLTDYPMKNGRATAYVCENFACQAPTNDVSTLKRMLGERMERRD